MKFTRTINVSGNETILGAEVSFNFNYSTNQAPTRVSFSSHIESNSIYGEVTKDGVTTYNVSGGIAPCEFLEAVELRGIEILKNYETV